MILPHNLATEKNIQLKKILYSHLQLTIHLVILWVPSPRTPKSLLPYINQYKYLVPHSHVCFFLHNFHHFLQHTSILDLLMNIISTVLYQCFQNLHRKTQIPILLIRPLYTQLVNNVEPETQILS
jgi:hypothetical protein